MGQLKGHVEYSDSYLYLLEENTNLQVVSKSSRMEELFASIYHIVRRLPARDLDIFILYYLLSWDQRNISKLFKITQSDVSHRVGRALARINFFITVPDFGDAFFNSLSDILTIKETKILKALFDTTSQTKASEKLGYSQGSFRYFLVKAVTALEEALVKNKESGEPIRREIEVCLSVYKNVCSSFNSARELKFQHRWRRSFTDTVAVIFNSQCNLGWSHLLDHQEDVIDTQLVEVVDTTFTTPHY